MSETTILDLDFEARTLLQTCLLDSCWPGSLPYDFSLVGLLISGKNHVIDNLCIMYVMVQTSKREPPCTPIDLAKQRIPCLSLFTKPGLASSKPHILDLGIRSYNPIPCTSLGDNFKRSFPPDPS